MKGPFWEKLKVKYNSPQLFSFPTRNAAWRKAGATGKSSSSCDIQILWNLGKTPLSYLVINPCFITLCFITPRFITPCLITPVHVLPFNQNFPPEISRKGKIVTGTTSPINSFKKKRLDFWQIIEISKWQWRQRSSKDTSISKKNSSIPYKQV